MRAPSNQRGFSLALIPLLVVAAMCYVAAMAGCFFGSMM
jgi:hypothetical protein